MGVDPTSFGGKRVEDGDEEEYDDDDDGDKEKNRNGKRSRRHNWQQKYEMEFGLIPIERDALTNDVTLAMCGFCKAFGRESKFEQLMQQDNETGENKKKRRRSLTTTKFFRAFRVDNIRSHLLGAHPRRWAEFEILPKQETIRSRFLQLQTGEYNYDGISMVDDVGLVHGDGDITGYQPQALTEGTS
jgi:hypothetical protein